MRGWKDTVHPSNHCTDLAIFDWNLLTVVTLHISLLPRINRTICKVVYDANDTTIRSVSEGTAVAPHLNDTTIRSVSEGATAITSRGNGLSLQQRNEERTTPALRFNAAFEVTQVKLCIESPLPNPNPSEAVQC